MANDSADVTGVNERKVREVIQSLRAGDRKNSATNSRHSAGRHYQAIGADRTQRSSTW